MNEEHGTKRFDRIFRSIGIAILVLILILACLYTQWTLSLPWGEIGLFLLPMLFGIPAITLESILFSVKFFLRPTVKRRSVLVLKIIETVLSVFGLSSVILHLHDVDLLGFLAMLSVVVIPFLWLIEWLILKKAR